MRRFFHKLFLFLSDRIDGDQNRYLAIVPFLYALGIALYFGLPTEPNPWLILSAVEILLFLLYFLYYSAIRPVLIGILLMMIGFINIEMQTAYRAKKVMFPDHETIYIQGRVQDVGKSAKGKARLLLTDLQNEEGRHLRGNYRITAATAQLPISVNDCVEMVATVFPPSPMPLLNGYQLNRKYFYESLSAIGYVNSEIFPIKCSVTPPINLQARFNQIRHRISMKIAALLPQQTAGVAEALLIGEKSDIPPQISDNYRNAGLAHFLSVSGLHLGSIAALFFFLIRWLIACIPAIALRFDGKKIAAVFAIIFSGIYLLLSGMAIPAQRAFIMTSVVLIGVLCNRRAISMRMVSFAALVILILSPQALISISFQMSFAAVYALVAFYELYAARLSRLSKSPSFIGKVFWYLAGIVICDFVASLATLPFSLYHFHMVAAYTSLGNLLAGPLIGLYLMPLVLVCLVSLPFGFAAWPIKALGFGIEILNRITDTVAHLPHSVLRTDSLSFTGFILIVIGGYWLCVWKSSVRRIGLIFIICGALSLCGGKHPLAIIAPNGQGMAVSDNRHQMILLPIIKTDSWIKQVWQQNFSLAELPACAIKALKSGKDDLVHDDLTCTVKGCLYREKLYIQKNGDVTLNKQKIDLTAGAYIYQKKNGEMYVRPLWNKARCRPWQKCFRQTKN